MKIVLTTEGLDKDGKPLTQKHEIDLGYRVEVTPGMTIHALTVEAHNA